MKKTTTLIHSGRDPMKQSGAVNPPVYRMSTIVFPTLEDYQKADKGTPYYDETKGGNTLDYGYGIAGTPTTFALQEALRTLEGGDACVITSSGLEAITLTLNSFLSEGDHLLVVDTIYGPTRRFCNKELKRYGIETTYYDPRIGAGIESLIQDNTKLIFLESPGSLTFEMQDVPAITAVAKKHGIVTALDNSWSTPLFFNPIEHGVDICIQAITKYINGHSDVILGAIITKGKEVTQQILRCYKDYGTTASPADCSLALRGLRSLAARMERHERSTQKVVAWLKERPEVARILYPADPDHPDYALWQRDWKGAGSLFSIVLDKTYSDAAVAHMIDNLECFSIGASWGGFESLVLALDPSTSRTAVPWQETGTFIRFYIGLENPEDLIVDLEKGFKRLAGK